VVPEGSGPRRRRPRKLAAFLLLTIASALVLVAVGVGGYPFYTDFQAARHQRALKSQLDQAAKDGADRAKLLEQYKNRTFAVGSPVTRILIPKLGVETVVVEGTSDEALAAGAGHYPQSPLPGDAGNVAIAGHRTMNGHPFGDLDKLVPGDQVILQTPFATYNYKIVPGFDGHANPWVTSPEDWTVISVTTQSHLLTLTTCNPKGQASQRLVARAEMVSSQPVT
jgi:sortase A